MLVSTCYSMSRFAHPLRRQSRSSLVVSGLSPHKPLTYVVIGVRLSCGTAATKVWPAAVLRN